MNKEFQELKALAEVATQGRWELREEPGLFVEGSEDPFLWGWDSGDLVGKNDEADNKYIVAACPATVLSLLSALEKTEKELTEARQTAK